MNTDCDISANLKKKRYLCFYTELDPRDSFTSLILGDDRKSRQKQIGCNRPQGSQLDLMVMRLPICARSGTCFHLEATIEVSRVPESAHDPNLCNRQICGDQKERSTSCSQTTDHF